MFPPPPPRVPSTPPPVVKGKDKTKVNSFSRSSSKIQNLLTNFEWRLIEQYGLTGHGCYPLYFQFPKFSGCCDVRIFPNALQNTRHEGGYKSFHMDGCRIFASLQSWKIESSRRRILEWNDRTVPQSKSFWRRMQLLVELERNLKSFCL